MFDDEAIEDFEAYQDRQSDDVLAFLRKSIDNLELSAVPFKYFDEWVPSKEAVSSRDVKLAILQHRYLAAKDLDSRLYAAALVEEEIEYRLSVDILFEEVIVFVVGAVNGGDDEMTEDMMNAIKYGHVRPINYDCLKHAYSEYEENCERFGDYSLKYVNALVNLCEMFGNEIVIKDAFEHLCQ